MLGEGVRSRDDATEEALEVGRDLGCDVVLGGGRDAGRDRSTEGVRDGGLDLSAEAFLEALPSFMLRVFRSSSSFLTCACKRSATCFDARSSFALRSSSRF